MQRPSYSETMPKKVVGLARARSPVDPDDANNGSTAAESQTPHDQPAELPCASGLNPLKNTSTASAVLSSGATQVVHSLEEGNALMKRLRQLESENASLANALTKVCDDNARLARHVSQQEEKCTELSTSPFAGTSVLHSLFEPEKTGWFGGSKAAAREGLEQLMQELQNEFVEYQASHASSNDEVQALIGELQNAHMNAQRLSAIVHEQQDVISRGPLSVAVRILPSQTEAERVLLNDLRLELERRSEREQELRQELRSTREELQIKTVENTRLQRDLQSLRQEGSHTNEVELQYMNDEIARLKTEVAQLQKALTTEEQLHKLKVNENNMLLQRLNEAENRPRAPATEERTPPQELPCDRCSKLQQECDVLNGRLQTVTREVQQLEVRLSELRQANELEVDELQREKAGLEQKLYHSVARDTLTAAEARNKQLSQELEFTASRAKQLEELLEQEREQRASAASRSGDRGESTLDDLEILSTLERNKARVERVEFQRNQLIEEVKQLRAVAAAKEEELIRLTRASQEDKQRINFLLKRCVTLTSDLNSSVTAKDALVEEKEAAQLELKKLRRESEETVKLHQNLAELRQKNDALQDRLSNVEVLENELVKAKETIAYMELAQSRTINVSQYAELQSQNSKLSNTLEPIKKQLEEARRELGRIKEENESLHAVLTRQQNTIKSHEEQAAALQANDAKMREKVNQLSGENARLRDVNETLEAQMTNMQDGIKEMAVKLEQERTRAQVAAEATYKEENAQLQRKLDAANATLATVRATQDNFVPEAIHKTTLAEKGRVSEELRQKTFDLDKLKSEILIYRQTIDDLETENEEHVRQIESLQATHQKERGATAERLAAEAKKIAGLNEELEELRSRVGNLQQSEERLLLHQKEMETAAQKHRRAFEDKCRQEEKLLETVAAINQEMEVQREELNRARSAVVDYKEKHEKLEAEVSAGAAHKLRQQQDMEVELERLCEEIRRLHAEKRAIELDFWRLREATKSDGPSTNIKANCHDNGEDVSSNSHAAAAAVTKESCASDRSGFCSIDAATPSADAAAQYARAEQLQMSLIQAQRQLEEQKRYNTEAAETFVKALDKADTEAAALLERVQQLESELHRKAQDSDDPLSLASGQSRKRRKKVAKKCLSTMAHVEELQGTDVLVLAAADGAVKQQQQAQLQQRRDTIEKLEQEVLVLRAENARHKENVATLTQELVDARDDLELATKDVDSRTTELYEQIQFLESQLRSHSADAQKDTDSHRLVTGSSRLHSELGETTNAVNTVTGNPDAKVQRLQLELQNLARELVQTKNKLVEYMAMADRLGIHYPFSPDMEGAAVLRLKAMQFDSVTGRTRASSAPRRPYAPSVSNKAASQGVRKKKRAKHQPKLESQFDKPSDLL
ncbi:hypothetical protein TraAM80_00353 [Trypanosoma rangeli]|uniref:Uncharacterized protein n=1 Tax=Trypanosoma rangeli TaxID=5698 RepID=A0A422P3R2_TRYRA|nr:uncharacterized protein TraAM80_00353 [Trypanosoma rangeli]RNF12342.1 hypothetical protein TraAM80_00353 [Trypanosoma rangeli]|eukprot:RNF12342.1 hypothetical protein TraAM80_00353 [Trypanosoma rangeli]